MRTKNFIIKDWGELKYTSPSDKFQVEGVLSRRVILESKDDKELFHDTIVATLWDELALTRLFVGDEVTATILFGDDHKTDGSVYLSAQVLTIKKVEKPLVIKW